MILDDRYPSNPPTEEVKQTWACPETPRTVVSDKVEEEGKGQERVRQRSGSGG